MIRGCIFILVTTCILLHAVAHICAVLRQLETVKAFLRVLFLPLTKSTPYFADEPACSANFHALLNKKFEVLVFVNLLEI